MDLQKFSGVERVSAEIDEDLERRGFWWEHGQISIHISVVLISNRSPWDGSFQAAQVQKM